jgi:N6-adenosine-specific RNA methylase IME4
MLEFSSGVVFAYNTDKSRTRQKKGDFMERAAATKKYRTILADPPWSINQKGSRGAVKHYDLMPLSAIMAMPVADLVEGNSHLYLWTPNNIIPEALQVVNAWGFTYRNTLVWGKPKLGLGVYIRTSHESCIFATRGRAPVKFHAQPSFMFCAQQDHSHKPEEQFAVIERLSHGPYLELFARRRQPGWDVWGNEIDSDIIIPDYPVPHYSAKALGEEV